MRVTKMKIKSKEDGNIKSLNKIEKPTFSYRQSAHNFRNQKHSWLKME